MKTFTAVFATIDAKENPGFYFQGELTPELVNSFLVNEKQRTWIYEVFCMGEVHNRWNDVFGFNISRSITKKEYKTKMSQLRHYERDMEIDRQLSLGYNGD